MGCGCMELGNMGHGGSDPRPKTHGARGHGEGGMKRRHISEGGMKRGPVSHCLLREIIVKDYVQHASYCPENIRLSHSLRRMPRTGEVLHQTQSPQQWSCTYFRLFRGAPACGLGWVGQGWSWNGLEWVGRSLLRGIIIV